jgi:threonine/homoserine/homoserine lactone efflux protein
MQDHLLTFLLAVLLLELTPGPNMAYLATLTLTHGRAAGLIATSGVAVGLAVHALVVGLGAGVLIQEYPLIYQGLRWIGVGYLLFLALEGYRTVRETSPGRADLATMAGALFLRGLFSNVFNPKSILFFVSVLPTFVSTGPSSAPPLSNQMATFGILYVGIATAVHGTIVTLAAQLRPWLIEGRRQLIVRRVLSVALALVAVWLAWTTAR